MASNTFEQLNRHLKQAEEVTPRLREAGAEQVMQLITGLDSAQALVNQIISDNARYPAEEVQRIEMIESALRTHMGRAARALAAGNIALATVAEERAQVPDAWWWRLPQLVREQQQQTLRAWLIRGGIVVAVLVVAFILYSTVFAPDPLVVARSQAYQEAQELAVGEQNYQGALDALNAGIAEVERIAAERGETPAMVELYALRGAIYETLGDAEAAARDFDAAGGDDNPEMLYVRVQFYLLSGKNDAALTDAKRLVELDPEHPASHMFVGDAYAAVGRWAEAYAAYDEAKALAFEKEEFASIYVLIVQREQAIMQRPPDFDTEAPTPDPLAVARSQAYQEAQELAINAQDYQGALDALNAGIAEVERIAAERGETPEMVELYALRGAIYEALGDTEAAARDFDAAGGEDSTDMLYVRVQFYLLSGKNDAALADAKRLVELDPEHPAAHMFVGDAYAAVGRWAEAYAAYDEAKALAFEKEEYASIYVLIVQREQALMQRPPAPDTNRPRPPLSGESAAMRGAGRDLERLAVAAHGCTRCAGAEGRRRVLSAANGPPDSPLLFVAEAPGRDGADRTGVPLYGDRTGDNFAHLLAVLGWPRAAVFITNAVLCNPRGANGRNRPPTTAEQRNCAPFLRATIDLVNPRYVVSLGRVALTALAEVEAHDLDLRRDVGGCLAWYGRALVPLYHPSPRVMASHRPLATQEGDFRRLAGYLRRDGVHPPG